MKNRKKKLIYILLWIVLICLCIKAYDYLTPHIKYRTLYWFDEKQKGKFKEYIETQWYDYKKSMKLYNEASLRNDIRQKQKELYQFIIDKMDLQADLENEEDYQVMESGTNAYIQEHWTLWVNAYKKYLIDWDRQIYDYIERFTTITEEEHKEDVVNEILWF